MSKITYEEEALQYISKLSSGGMRDAISLLDKCLAYSDSLTLENVVKALGTVDYDVMFELAMSMIKNHTQESIATISDIHMQGKDLKQFVKSFIQFLIDVNKYGLGCDWRYISLPQLPEYENKLQTLLDNDSEGEKVLNMLDVFVGLDANLKYSSTPKYDIEAQILLNW